MKVDSESINRDILSKSKTSPPIIGYLLLSRTLPPQRQMVFGISVLLAPNTLTIHDLHAYMTYLGDHDALIEWQFLPLQHQARKSHA